MGGLFGSKQTSSTNTTPYSGTYKKQMQDFYNNTLTKNLNNPATPYTGQLSAGMTDTQNNAMSGLAGLAGTSALTGTINGDYLNPDSNPYLTQYYDQAADKVRSSLADANDYINGQFNTRGLYNSSARQESLQKQADNAGDTLANLATNIYGGAYNQERQNQINAINQQAGLYDAMFNQGTQQQQTDQSALDAEYKEWLRQQGMDDADIDRMMQYFSLVKNPSQTTTQSSSPGVGNVALAMLGK